MMLAPFPVRGFCWPPPRTPIFLRPTPGSASLHLGLFMLAPSGDPHLFASYPRFRFAPPGAIHVGPLRGPPSFCVLPQVSLRSTWGYSCWPPPGTPIFLRPTPGSASLHLGLVHSSRGIGTSQRGGVGIFLFASFSFCEPLWNCGKLRGRIVRFPRRPTGKNEGAEASRLCAF